MDKEIEDEKINEDLDKLIEILCREKDADIDNLGLDEFSFDEKREIFRVLMIKREISPLDSNYMKLQNEFLEFESKKRGIIKLEDIEFKNNFAIFEGDIRTLKVDAIVNSCDPNLIGNFDPNDGSIEVSIISAGGLQIRQELNHIMTRKMCEENRWKAEVTKAYNLPSKSIIHTVGPEIKNCTVMYNDKINLSECYKACLDKANELGFESIAFPCIATGTYNFPKELASKIAVSTVKEWIEKNNSKIKVIFCVFDRESFDFYKIHFRDYDIRWKYTKFSIFNLNFTKNYIFLRFFDNILILK